jgi:hypothetical protein
MEGERQQAKRGKHRSTLLIRRVTNSLPPRPSQRRLA